MADYWKSQPKKFCDYCKCWIADNKPSIEFHERGKNHKENVAKKISEIKKKSLEKAKEEEKRSKEFAAMEEAAMKAYQEDLKRLGAKTECADRIVTPKKQEEKKQKKKKEKEREKEKVTKEKVTKRKVTVEESSDKTKEWIRGFSPEGYLYYYNTVSGESQWEKPEGFQDDHKDPQTASQWIEGTSEDGRSYYYNTETGVSTWEKPDGFVSPSHEDSQGENDGEKSSKRVSKEAESSTGRESSKSQLLKPKRNFRRKTEDEEKPPRPKKISPYGEWQVVKSESTYEEDAEPVPQETCPAVSKTKMPYGAWEEIVEEEDSDEKEDLELPSTECDSQSAPILEVPEDAKVIFKEKTVTSLGDTTAGIPVFKKRKFENGKSRNIRQRWDDL